MITQIRNFLADERGVVTVDWVLLTAMIVGMGVMVIEVVVGGAMDQSDGLGAVLESREPG